MLSGADVLSPWASLQEAEERIAEAKAVGRKALEENARLQDHIHDLETRKRAPLYQKKQEEELRAAIEKAQEAEGRAVEAEARAKEAKVIVFIMGFPADTLLLITTATLAVVSSPPARVGHSGASEQN